MLENSCQVKKMNIKESAKDYIKHGYSVFPVHPANHETKPKAPYGSWKEYQEKIVSEDDFDRVFIMDQAIACACGPVSGNLLVLDFDNPELFPEWKKYLGTINDNLLNKITIIETPSGGFHVPVRVDGPDVPGNKKLAMARSGKETWIETRGAGGYVLVPPSEGYLGSYSRVPLLSQAECNELLNLCKTFDQRPIEEDVRHAVYKKDSSSVKPGDLFNELYSHQISDAVVRSGWKESFEAKDGNRHFIRPGKTVGTGATLKDNIFYVWSSNGGIPVGGHSAFSVYAWLYHAGDYRAAAAALVKSGCLPGYEQVVAGGVELDKSQVANAGSVVFDESQVATKEDLNAGTLKGIYLDDLIEESGHLIKLGIQGLTTGGMPAINQFAFPTVCAAISKAIGNKFAIRNPKGLAFCNLFSIKVGGTSTGKTQSDNALYNVLRKMDGMDKFISLTDIASGASLARRMSKENVLLAQIDEISYLFKRSGKSDPLSDGIRKAMLDLYSKSGSFIDKPFGNSKNDIRVELPFLTVTGNSTPAIFNEFTLNDLESGLLQRFDFFYYDGKSNDSPLDSGGGQSLELFASGLQKLNNINPVEESSLFVTEIELNKEAGELLQDYVKKNDKRIEKSSNDDGASGMYSRAAYSALKYALIHIASSRATTAIEKPCGAGSMAWGIKVSERIVDWKVGNFANGDLITVNEFDRTCKQFIQGVKSCMKAGKRPTFGTITGRVKWLKGWKVKDSKEIIEMLVRRGDIIVDNTPKRKTAYYLKGGLPA